MRPTKGGRKFNLQLTEEMRGGDLLRCRHHTFRRMGGKVVGGATKINKSKKLITP